jgi:hypothetical protein
MQIANKIVKAQLVAMYIAMIVTCAGCAKTSYPIASTIEKLFGIERKVEPTFESYTTMVEQKRLAEETKQKRIAEAIRQREAREREIANPKRSAE